MTNLFVSVYVKHYFTFLINKSNKTNNLCNDFSFIYLCINVKFVFYFKFLYSKIVLITELKYEYRNFSLILNKPSPISALYYPIRIM